MRWARAADRNAQGMTDQHRLSQAKLFYDSGDIEAKGLNCP
jgi:hypothetical protein